jgi:hypothetical protein
MHCSVFYSTLVTLRPQLRPYLDEKVCKIQILKQNEMKPSGVWKHFNLSADNKSANCDIIPKRILLCY